MTPKVGHSVGTARQTPKGKALEGTYKETSCVFKLIEQQKGSFMDGLRAALDSLQPHRPYLVSLTDSGGRSEVYVGVFVDDGTTTGFTLDSELAGRLAQFAIDLSVEVYWD